MKKISLIIFLLGNVLFITTATAGGVLVIANKNVPVDDLNRSEISDIYLGSKTKWENGDKIRVVMLKKGPVHEAFSQNIVGTTPAKLKNFWKKVVFTGTGTPPKIFRKESDLLEFVARTKGSVGYVDASASHDGVKVISIRD